jgi:hypothetical protein
MHQRSDFHQFDVLKRGVEILHFLARIIDAIPFELSGFQGLTGGNGLVQIGAGRIDLFGEKNGV